MIETYDVGSTPHKTGSQNETVEIFIDKLNAGIDIPKYSQVRDMNQMFLDSIGGLKRIEGGYCIEGHVSISPEKAKIAEVQEIEQKSKLICEETGKPFRMGICVTGPYDLSFQFPEIKDSTRYWLFKELGNIISKVVDNNIFSNNYGKVSMVSIDEPSFGTFDDSDVSAESEGREYLLKAWQNIAQTAKSKNAEVIMHLHATGDKLPWEVASAKIIESHVDDHLYTSEQTKELLEEKDKFLKASIAKTDFDGLITSQLLNSGVKETDVGQRGREAWEGIEKGKTNPIQFLENLDILKKRLDEIANRFGVERVPYAGPECGLKYFPTYESATESLRRVSQTAHSY